MILLILFNVWWHACQGACKICPKRVQEVISRKFRSWDFASKFRQMHLFGGKMAFWRISAYLAWKWCFARNWGIWWENEILAGKWCFGRKIAYLAGKWRVWRESGGLGGWPRMRAFFWSLNHSNRPENGDLVRNEFLAGKWRFGGKMAYLAGKWRAWRVALNEIFVLIFKSSKSAAKWLFGAHNN